MLVLPKVVQKRLTDKEIDPQLVRFSEYIRRFTSNTVGSLLGGAMELGEKLGTYMAYTIDSCPEAVREKIDLKAQVTKLLEGKIYNKYFVKQFIEQFHSAVVSVSKLSVYSMIDLAGTAKVALAGIYEGLNEEELSYNIEELKYRNNVIQGFLSMLENKTLPLEELLDKTYKQIDRELKETQERMALVAEAKNGKGYIQHLQQKLQRGKELQGKCDEAIRILNSFSKLKKIPPSDKKYTHMLESMLFQLKPYIIELGPDTLENVRKKFKNDSNALDELKQHFERQKENYAQKNQECRNKIQKLKEIKKLGKEGYSESLNAHCRKLQIKKNILKENVFEVLIPVSLRPWENRTFDNMTKLRVLAKQEKNTTKEEESREQRENLEKKLLASMRENLQQERRMMGAELSKATVQQVKRKEQGKQKLQQKQKRKNRKRYKIPYDKLKENVEVQEGWLQYGKRVIDQQMRDYKFAKRSYLEKIQKSDRKMEEKGLSAMIKENPIAHKKQYELTVRNLVSKDKLSPGVQVAFSCMDNIRASVNALTLLKTANVYSASKNVTKYFSNKISNLTSLQQPVRSK